jgi:hypothetical protein
MLGFAIVANFRGVYRLCFEYIKLKQVPLVSFQFIGTHYGVGIGVMSFEFIAAYPWNVESVFFISFSKYVTTSSMCGGELSFSSGLLIM